MNRDAILFHLGEAKEQLDETIADLKSDADYDFGDFKVAVSHLYHHINTAWNGRDASAERHRECSQEDFGTWRKFPDESELFLE